MRLSWSTGSSRAPVLGLPAALESPRLQPRLAFSFIKQKPHVSPRALGASRDEAAGAAVSQAFKIHGVFVPTCQRGKFSLGGGQYPAELPGAPVAIKIARLYKS